MASLMVGCVVVVCGPPHGGAWCGGVWPTSLWGVVWCFVAPHMAGHALVVFGAPLGRAWRGGVWSPAWCGVALWRVALCGRDMVW